MLGQQAQSLMFNYRAFSTQDEVKRFILTRDEELKPAVMTGMQKLYADSLIVLLEVVDANYNPVLFNTRDSIEKYLDIDSLRTLALSYDSVPVGNFYVINRSLYHPIQVSIKDKNGITGYVISWRRVATTKAVLDRFSQLLGSNASLFVGNKDNSLWTNFIGPVQTPIPDNKSTTNVPFSFTNSEGRQMLGAMKSIPNTSWVFLVEFPQNQVLAAANKFLKWMIIIGAIINLIAIFVTWYMSVRLTRPLKQLTTAATTIANGNYKSTVNVSRYDEIGKLSRAFNAMTVKVSRSKEELEHKIKETEHMASRLRELSAHLQNIREEERIHIAREMHDELGQLLTGFKMDVSWLHKKLDATQEPAVKEKLEEMMEIVNEAAIFVRKLASELRPSILDDLGLVPALDWHSQEFKRRSHINVEFRSPHDDVEASKDIATGLFRIFQESLTNVARHAEAKKVVAELELTDGNIQLTITDDGKGFDTKSGERKTLGILGMRERATMLGGKLKIYSAPGKGTTVLITVPQHHSITYSPA